MVVVKQTTAMIFTFITLFASLAIVIYLVLAAIYFYNAANAKPPNTTYSTFFLWTSIIMALIFVGIFIYAIVRLIVSKHKVILDDEDQDVDVQAVKVPDQGDSNNLSNLSNLSNLPNNNTSFSDIPVNSNQKLKLNNELIALSSIND